MAIRKDMFDALGDHRFRGIAGGKLMIFGRPTLLWDNAMTPEEHYKRFGFEEVHTMDVSPYEGATHIFDLNSPDLPADLEGQYQVVITGGTLEHVFCVHNVFRTAARLLKSGGWLYCAAPVNNWIDHGFYQINPTLKFDYFHENGFEFGVSRASIAYASQRMRKSVPIYPGEANALNFLPARVGHSVQVKKLENSTFDRIPTQSVYLAKHAGQQRKFAFRTAEPMISVGGERFKPFPMERFELSQATLQERDQHFVFPFRQAKYPASIPGRPFRSQALMYEDGRLMPWIVSAPELIDDRPGSFTHQHGFVHFSPTRGEPSAHSYELAFPVEPDSAASPHQQQEESLVP